MDLEDFVCAILAKEGCDVATARTCANHLVEANLMGHHSHGVGMVPSYCKSLSRGLARGRNPDVKKLVDSGPVLSYDAQRTIGQVAGAIVMQEAIERSKEYGVCVVSLRDAHHLGRIGAYAEMAAAAGFVSIHFVNVKDHPTIVAPFEGHDARSSTNPVTIGVPASSPGGEPVILDFATSTIPLGKARVAFARGIEVDEGCLIDSNGKPTRDPGVMFPGCTPGGAYITNEKMGALTCFGLHKGAGLNLMCELLAGALGGGTSSASSLGNSEIHRQSTSVNNMVAIVFDPGKLADIGAFHEECAEMLKFWKASNRAVQVPGEPERQKKAKALREGIQVVANEWMVLCDLADKHGISKPPVVSTM